jgi:simple sugar transport system ATP-binding protein
MGQPGLEVNPPSATLGAPVPALPGPGAGAIDVRGAWKSFGATRALIDVTMSVAPGEARALVGRNGAGKSTLVSLLTGVHRPDAGEISVAGKPAAAGARAIACVYQHSRLVPALSVAENLMLGRYPRARGSRIDWQRVRAEAERQLAPWGLTDHALSLVEDLDPVQAKVVEICRALMQHPRVLLLDEPTAGLDRRDAERLFDVVDRLKVQGTTIVYVSHQLEEVYRLCESATVLRDARHVLTAPLAELPMRALVTAMVGEDAPPELTAHVPVAGAARERPRRPTADARAPVRLEAHGLTVPSAVDAFDLEVRRGECVGIAGLDGSGKTEIGAVLAGLLRPSAGSIWADGRRVPFGDVRAAMAAGIAYVPPDRHGQGLIPLLPVSENATLTAARRLARRLTPVLPRVLLERDRDAVYRRLADQWEIIASSPRQLMGELSGGNQQKGLMARGLATDPAVVVMHNPTAGIDVAAKSSIMRTLEEVFARGACGVVISEDPEDFALCSRILVVFKGRRASCLEGSWTEGDLLTAMQGADR